MPPKLDQNWKFFALLLLFLLIVAGIIITTLISFGNIEYLMIQQLMDKKVTETKFAAAQIETHIIKVRDEMISLSKLPELLDVTEDQCTLLGKKKLVNLPNGKADSFFIANEKGTIIGCSSSDYGDYLGLNIQEKDYFKIPQLSNEPYIAGIIKQGNNKNIIVAVPLFETTAYTPYPNFVGKFKGILFSIIDVNQLYYLYLLPVINNDDGSFFIGDTQQQEILLQSEKIDKYGDIMRLIPKKSSKNPMIQDLNPGGATILTSADIIFGKEQWKLQILTPLDKIAEETKIVQQGHLLSLAFIIVILIGTSLFAILLYKSKEKIKHRLDEVSTTLEKFGITAEIEEERYTPTDIILEPQKIYLLKDVDEGNGIELFVSSLNRGLAGLGIVRDDPRIIRKKFNLRKTPFLWLTSLQVENIPCEKDITAIAQVIMEFIKKSEKSVIFIEGIDYLILENGKETVIKGINLLKDIIAQHNSLIIISINPLLMDEATLKVIEALTIDVYGKELKGNVELTELEKKILQLINEKNNSNTLVSYRDVTSHLGITKPTTRVKINRLFSLGLLNIDTNGRFKSLKITSRGRKIL